MSEKEFTYEEARAWLEKEMHTALNTIIENGAPLKNNDEGVKRLTEAAMGVLGDSFAVDWRDHVEISINGTSMTVTAKTELGNRILVGLW